MTRRTSPRAEARASVVVTAVAALCIAAAVTYRIFDTDLWQLLIVGKAMWARHAIPQTDEWTWRMWGQPEVTSSWLYRALLWPVWAGFGAAGLVAWRWIVTLATFALLGATARRLGARGFIVPVVLVSWALLYRARADIRPEVLAGLLLAVTQWILVTRRAGGPDRALWLVLVTCAWANVHYTVWLGLGLQTLFALDGGFRRRNAAPWWRSPWTIAFFSLAACFINPFGMRALWGPIEFALRWRDDPTFHAIAELHPLTRAFLIHNPFLFLPWLALILWWARARRLDRVECVMFVVFALAALRWVRLLGFYALVAAPFVARDVHALVESLRWPAWTRAAWVRAALASATMAVLTAVQLRSRNGLEFGLGLDPSAAPVAACDFITAHEVRGRAFNDFHYGGYLAYRFWPDRSRLPFMTTQPELADAEDRRLCGQSMTEAAAWRELDRRYTFDYALLDRARETSGRRQDFFDADSTWALVFADDAALLFARRGGAMGRVAEEFAFQVFPGGVAARERLVNACFTDAGLRARARADVERQIAASPRHAQALFLRGMFDLMDGQRARARAAFEEALRVDPDVAQAHWYLGLLALDDGRAREAVERFERVRALGGRPAGLSERLAQAMAARDARSGRD